MSGEQLTKEAFEQKWWAKVRKNIGFIKAYNDLEWWHDKKYGHRRYSSYKSFAKVRDYKK